MSPNTRDLVAEAGGFTSDADSYADDLFYWSYKYSQRLMLLAHYILAAKRVP